MIQRSNAAGQEFVDSEVIHGWKPVDLNFKFSEWVEQNSCGWPSFTAFKVLSHPLGKVRTLEAHWKGFQFGVAGKKNGTEVGVAVLRDLAQARMI